MSYILKNLVLLPALFILILAFDGTSIAAQDPIAAKFVPRPSAEAAKSGEARADRPTNAESTANIARVGVQTTDPIALSLNDAIRRALENNNDIEIARDDVRFQETQIRSQLGFYDQVLSFTPNFSRTSRTGSRPTKDITVNTSIAQAIQATGGNYTTFFNNTRTENVFAQAQVSSGSINTGGGGTSAIYSSSLGIRFTQPLARNRTIDNTRRNLRIARRRLEQTDADFRRQATEIVAQVQRAYWDLVFALRDQQNRVANLDLTKENLREVEARIAAGAAAPLARAEVATELANREGDLLLATQQVSIAENALKRLLLKDSVSPEWLQSFVPTEKPAISLDPVSLDDAVQDAMENRHELKRLKLASDINSIDLKYFKNQTKPQVDFNSTFSLDGLSRSGQSVPFTTNFFTAQTDLALLAALNETRASIPGLQPVVNPQLTIPAQPGFQLGGFSQSLSNMFRSDAPNFSFGLTFSFPFRNRAAEANLAGARVQENQIAAQTRAQEQVIIVEVRNAVQAVETTRQRVLTARRARENAEIQLEGERKLFDSGKSTTFLLFQRENALTNARNAEIRAETDYSKAISDLQRVTSTTFQLNNIEVASPSDGK